MRRSCIFASAPPDCSILEIGAAHNGIAPKRAGFRTQIVDYIDRDGLVKKYQSFPQYSPDDIEEVDHVVPAGSSIADVVGDRRFDVIIASHVLEHTVSLVHFLQDLTALLEPEGVIALVVPDRRYCFDRFRERSSIGRVIDIYHAPPRIHTAGTLAEFTLNAVKHRGTTSWVKNHRGRYSLLHTSSYASAKLAAALSQETYEDVHNWVFTPHHLRLLVRDLADLGFLELYEVKFHDTVGHEFFLNLRRGSRPPEVSRETLLALADEELRTMDLPVFEAEAEGILSS